MGSLEPIELPETALIIGDNFPTQDETAYMREAHSQRSAAQNAGGAGGAALAAARYTAPQFRGLAGSTLADALTGHHQTLSADEGRHLNVATWMDLGAENITQTKTAMNRIAADYHETYETLSRRAQDETWPQTRLRQEKDQAVADAQARVRAARVAFEDRHRTVGAAVVNGDAPDRDPAVRPAGYFPPKPPPQKPWNPCWISGPDADAAATCPADTTDVEYFDDDGNLVTRDVNSPGPGTVMERPGPNPQAPEICYVPPDGDRSVCAPDTSHWIYKGPNGSLVDDVLQPDGGHRYVEQPPGPKGTEHEVVVPQAPQLKTPKR